MPPEMEGGKDGDMARHDPADGGCQQIDDQLRGVSVPDPKRGRLHKRVWWTMKKYLLYSRLLGPTRLAQIPEVRASRAGKAIHPGKSTRGGPSEALDLKPGEWARVKSAGEIFATLDSKGRHKGLGINPEQMGFSGKRFKVFKVVDKIRLETTGELRKMNAPTVLLEGVTCDGRFHGGCDRSCYCFWREDWLERAPAEDAGA